MSITKQKDRTYNVRISYSDNDGKRREKNKKGFTSLTLAKKWERKTLDEIDEILANHKQQKNRMLLRDVYEMWLSTYKPKVADTTLKKTDSFMQLHVLCSKWFKNSYVDEITPTILQQFVNELSAVMHNYKKNLMPFKQTLAQCVVMGLIDETPFNRIIMPQPKPSPIFTDRLDFYTIEQLNQFMSSAKVLYGGRDDVKYRIYALFRVLAFTGMRRGELLALKWTDIDYQNKTIKVNKNLVVDNGIINKIHPPKTKAGNRNVRIDDNTLTILRHWQAIQSRLTLASGLQSTGIIFTNSTLDNYQLVSKLRPWLITIAEHARLPRIKVHGFRHTYATLAIQAGMNVKQLQYQLGHDDVQTTLSVYSGLTETDKAKTADVFTSLVNF
ncbi:tyrosine-type recombinase/integrase [Weissella sagaensis]|uniref:Tyrosine-type recombinase/integrase n=1 Tax=Weissella sagaensis TaxID=2559928 RepID=A0ABW1RTB9_9LACO|nr:tyrosine-type recombinase/integrase [Weissella sagaensis]